MNASVRKLQAALLLVLITVAPLSACLWDSDTLAMERQRFPDALELIAGKFLRHSKNYYQWRIQDREPKLYENPTPQLYDDLAVAYDKLGQSEKAIQLMLEKRERYPNLYETHANLGTFYIHNGELERGIKQIELALVINPDAHFGREVYQKHLVKYILSKQREGAIQYPLDSSLESFKRPRGFAKYLLDHTGEAYLDKAIKGVLGMMRFGNFDSPILLEALGDLLISKDYRDDAKRLATRAYLKASYSFKEKTIRDAYRKLAEESLKMQTAGLSASQMSLDDLEKTFSAELTQADQWFASLKADEEKWIAEGRNVDEAYAEKYYKAPQIDVPTDYLPIALISFGVVVLGCALYLKRRRWLKRKAIPSVQ